MNKNLLIGGIVVVIVVVLAFVLIQNQSTPFPTPRVNTTPDSAQTEKNVLVDLMEQNESSESGTAVLKEENGSLVVTLNMTGGAPGITQPAHIHVGACPDVGAVKYPLNSVVDGMSETTLSVTLDQLKAELPLGINVHKSGDEADIYVSCGDLVL